MEMCVCVCMCVCVGVCVIGICTPESATAFKIALFAFTEATYEAQIAQ